MSSILTHTLRVFACGRWPGGVIPGQLTLPSLDQMKDAALWEMEKPKNKAMRDAIQLSPRPKKSLLQGEC